jgi:hypothetical protein
MTQMTQSPTAARPRWRAHRLAHHDPNDPNVDALRAHRLTRSMLAGWRPVACRPAGWRAGWRRARFDGGGGPSGDRSFLREGSQKIFYFYANRAMLTV